MPRSGRGGDRKPLWTDYARGRNLVGAEAGTVVGGVSAGTDPNIAEALVYSAEALVYSAEALSGRLIVDTVVGHSGR